MRLKHVFPLSFLIITSLALFSCSNKTEILASEKLEDYLPLQPGKYITYRLDSLNYTNFGTVEVTSRYQVKHVVDAQNH